MTAPENLVLLFYDGYERQAETAPLAKLKATLRRHARFSWRKLRRQQVRTGFYTSHMNLRRALRLSGYNVRVNDFAAALKYPDHPIGVTGYPSVLEKVDLLPNPRLLAPGLFSTPLEAPDLFEDPRNRLYIMRGQWMADIFEPWYGDRMRHWTRGYDLRNFEDTINLPKTTDVLIYDKIYHDRETYLAQTIEPFIARLQDEGRSYEIVRYGTYNITDYLAQLRRSRCMAFFAHQENQGSAYQEAMAMNVPVFAWDEGIWLDPLAQELSDEPVACCSVPYFDERCGLTFRIGDMAEQWQRFWRRIDAFRPRDYVGDALSYERSARAYIAAYREIADGQVAPARTGREGRVVPASSRKATA